MNLIKLTNPIFVTAEKLVFIIDSGTIFFTSDFIVCAEQWDKQDFFNMLRNYEKLEVNQISNLKKLELYKKIREIVNNKGLLYKIITYDFFDLEDANKPLYIYINIEDNPEFKQYMR